MKKSLLFLSAFLIIISCSSNDSNSESLFRSNYNNTSWADADGVIYTFKTGKIAYITTNTACYFSTIGSYSNVEYDGCVYNTVTNSIISEDNDTFTVKQTTSSGTGSFCPATTVTYTFQVLDENTIDVQTNYDGSQNSYSLTKTNTASTQSCVDGTPIGFLW
jgi:hypothetical protein